MISKNSMVIVLLVLGILVLYAISISIAYAQQVLPNVLVPPKKTSNTTSMVTTSPAPVKLHAVKITSPTKGQQVPIGKNLTVTGTSIGNPISHCQVSVIVNSIRPYHPATAAGPGGATDYSKWNFVLTPKYTTIKEGPNNKITARYTCSDNPSALSFYSVNVTGVAQNAITPSSVAIPQATTTKVPVTTPNRGNNATSFSLPPISATNLANTNNHSTNNSVTIRQFNNEPSKIIKSFNNKVKR